MNCDIGILVYNYTQYHVQSNLLQSLEDEAGSSPNPEYTKSL